jgi:hypothetical protein
MLGRIPASSRLRIQYFFVNGRDEKGAELLKKS